MTANASKDINSATALMAPVAGKVSEAVLTVMQYFGIRKIEVLRIRSASAEKTVGSIEFFKETPQEMTPCGTLVKDSIAEILASVGIVKLEIEATEEDLKTVAAGYEKLVEYNRSVTAGSTESTNAEEAKQEDKATDAEKTAEGAAE